MTISGHTIELTTPQSPTKIKYLTVFKSARTTTLIKTALTTGAEILGLSFK